MCSDTMPDLYGHRPVREAITPMGLRHTSTVTSTLARNMSLDAGQASQLIHTTDDFEETHRHYSFIAVLALMSLFLLITISITGLILGFCRKKSGSHSKSDDQTDGGSQFELDDIDIDMDADIKMRKGDPHGLCYYHLSDDDMDEDTEEDDDEDNGTGTDRKGKKKEKGRRERKWKRLRDSGYYYHLYTNDDEDSSWEDDKQDQGCAINRLDVDATGPPSVQSRLPKRSTTFPQIHNVLNSCLGRHNSHTENSQYEMLQPGPLACKKADSSVTVAHSLRDNSSPTVCQSQCLPSSPSASSCIHHHNNHLQQQQQQQHIQTTAQIENYAAAAPNTLESLDRQSNRPRHNQHKQQRLARNKRQSPNQLHQHKKHRPSHIQHYSSLSYHRHTRLHQAIKHNLLPTQKRLPATAVGGGGRLYKSHSIHAIPCSEPAQHLSAGTQDSSQCQVQIRVQRVAFDTRTDCNEPHQQNRPVNKNV